MLPSLDNFVSFGGDVFKTRPDYCQMVLDIYQTSISSEQLGENDAVNGCKLEGSVVFVVSCQSGVFVSNGEGACPRLYVRERW